MSLSALVNPPAGDALYSHIPPPLVLTQPLSLCGAVLS